MSVYFPGKSSPAKQTHVEDRSEEERNRPGLTMYGQSAALIPPLGVNESVLLVSSNVRFLPSPFGMLSFSIHSAFSFVSTSSFGSFSTQFLQQLWNTFIFLVF